MTPLMISPDSRIWLTQLLIVAARTLVLAAVAGLLLIAFRVRGASLRLQAWKVVLYAGLSMPILAWLLPPLPVRIPFLRSSMSAAKVVNDERASYVHATDPLRGVVIYEGTETGNSSSRPQVGKRVSWIASISSIRWTTLASCVYVAMALFLFSRLLIGLAIASRLVRSSIPIGDSRVTVWLSSNARLLGQRFVSHVRESELVAVPLTVGVFDPKILLPSTWREWDDAKLNAVLAHESSHVARWDYLSQYMSLLHRAIFWFSPLTWWLHRQIIELAEQVSDEAVLSGGAERNQYARTLLGFLKTVQTGSGRVHWQGVSMASSSQAEKRLEKILAWRGDKRMKGKRWILLFVAIVALPTAYLIAAGSPAQVDQSAQNSSSGDVKVSQSNAPAVPAIPATSESHTSPAKPARNHRHGYSYSYGFDDEQRFVIVSGKADGFTMSGSGEDARHVEKLRQKISGDFIWFQRDEKSYIIRDQATVERARQLWAPQEELGKKQEELGRQQEALGKQQAELGARMEKVQVQVPDMTAQLDKLKAEMKELGPSATMEQVGHLQSEMGELQSKIGEIQSHAGEQQGKLGEEMGILGEQQGKLGAQQGELGRQQGELAEKATREMKQLLDDSIKKGIAQPESPELIGTSI